MNVSFPPVCHDTIYCSGQVHCNAIHWSAGCVNPIKHEADPNNILKLVFTVKKTQHVSNTEINWLMLFREIIAVYSENHTKPINTFCEQNAELKQVNHIDTTVLSKG
jgi:hypothetical protein